MINFLISIKRLSIISVFLLALGPLDCFSRSVTIESSQYSIDENENLVQYTNGRFLLDSMEISASRIIYQQEEQLFKFDGHIFIDNQKTLILAEKGTYAVKSGELILYNISFFDQIRKTYIKAEKIERIAENKFIIHDGTFTSCNPKTPAWEISSSYVIYEFENYASSVNTVVNLYSVPIFYSPYLSWPTTSKRGSGFLFPTYQRVDNANISKSYGNRITVPYFRVLDQDHDLTITLDFLEKRGLGYDFDYQYAFLEGMRGQISGWYLNESQNRDLNEEEMGNESIAGVDQSPERYHYTVDHKQDIFWNGQFFFHQNGNSDNEVNREYFDSQVEQDSYYSRSFDTVFKWDDGSISARHDEGEDYLYQSIFDKETNRETKIHKQPSFSFNQSFSRILDSNLMIDIQDTWTDYEVQYGWDGVINQAEINAKLPFNIDFLNVIPQHHRNFYQFDLEYTPDPDSNESRQNPDSYGWSIDTRELEINFELFRYFQNSDDVNTGKLVIVPKMTFFQIDEVDQDRIKIIGKKQAQDNIVYDLSFYYLNKDITTENITKIFQLDVSQTHNYYQVENGREVLPLEITLSLFPSNQFSSELFYRYDNEQNKITETRASIKNRSEFGDSVRLQYTNNTETYSKVDGTSVPIAKVYTIDGFFNISPVISLNLSGNWDLNRHDAAYRYSSTDIERLDRELVSGLVALTYQHNCYRVRLQYTEDIKEQEVAGYNREYLDKRISLNFSLNELDVSNIYGLTYADNSLTRQ